MNTIKRIVWISSVILILVSSAGRGAHAAEAADKTYADAEKLFK